MNIYSPMSTVKQYNAPSVFCTKRKFRKRFSGSLTDDKSIAVIHVEIKGEIEEISVHGYNYFLTII